MSKKLFICEKPSQARDIARVLGVTQKQEFHIEGRDIIVTWCLGHLLETAMPEHYCDNIKPWRVEKLPIIPQIWHMLPVARVKKQLNAIKKLIKQTEHIVIATDADREGELIAREVMTYCNYKGFIERLWLSALDDLSIKKALKSIKPGSATINLYYAGLGRQRADWTIGMNMTMATSALFGKYGEGVLSVGRVQTPTLQLIVTRDLAIEQFKTGDYYELYANFIDQEKQGLWLKWLTPKAMQDDEAGRCLNKEKINAVANKIHKQNAVIKSFIKTDKQQAAPLPFSLSSLQKKASSLYGFTAKKTLSIAQELYEKYKATSYPRTDSNYLPVSQFSEAKQILRSLKQGSPNLSQLITECDTNFKSPAWNDKKVSAHHGIIPTTKKVKIESMPADVAKIYNLIRMVYIAQFLGNYKYKHSKIIVDCQSELFTATGKIPMYLGWKTAISKELWGSESRGKDETVQELPNWHDGQQLLETAQKIASKKTKPLSHFSEGTLIGAMESIGRYVEEPKLKKILKETSGIGTQATRASIIELLIKRDYISRQQKKLISTDKGRSLISLLPKAVKDPATTAVWEQNLEEVASGNFALDIFLKDQRENLNLMLKSLQNSDQAPIKALAPKTKSTTTKQCPTCNKTLVRKKTKAKNNFFWSCPSYPKCKYILNDYQGKPANKKIASKPTSHKCAKCNEGYLTGRKGKYGKFYGCSNYPKCKNITKELTSNS